MTTEIKDTSGKLAAGVWVMNEMPEDVTLVVAICVLTTAGLLGAETSDVEVLEGSAVA